MIRRGAAAAAVLGFALLVPVTQARAEEEVPPAGEQTVQQQIDRQFGAVVGYIAPVLFFNIFELEAGPTAGRDASGEPVTVGFPLIVAVLLFGAVFYTIYHRFLNFRGLRHAIDVIRGRYDNPDDPGEISHFQALTSALSATIGLGNIAGVAVAVGTGGPGAVMWMVLIGFFGMCAKFHECTLAQLFRKIDSDGVVHGGPMYYLEEGLRERGLGFLGKPLAIFFAVLCVGGSVGGGNMFQANQSFQAVSSQWGGLAAYDLEIGLGLALMVGVVIIGGIRRIAEVTEKLIPTMCMIYVMACLTVLFTNAAGIPDAFGVIFSEAFTMKAGIGGLVGVMVTGIKRAVFSNEAGIGSAAIAHSAARTDEPVREGIVAMVGPFIDTVLICTMTALVVIVSGAYQNPAAGEGVEMTRWAFSETLSWFPAVLAVCVAMFAYSTMISWSYYGEKAWAYLFGRSRAIILVYKLIFLVFVVIGTVSSLSNVIDFSDMMILGMAFPNIIGGLILAPKVKEALSDYWARYQRREFKIYK